MSSNLTCNNGDVAVSDHPSMHSNSRIISYPSFPKGGEDRSIAINNLIMGETSFLHHKKQIFGLPLNIFCFCQQRLFIFAIFNNVGRQDFEYLCNKISHIHKHQRRLKQYASSSNHNSNEVAEIDDDGDCEDCNFEPC